MTSRAASFFLSGGRAFRDFIEGRTRACGPLLQPIPRLDARML